MLRRERKLSNRENICLLISYVFKIYPVFVYIYFEIGAHHAALVVLESAMLTRLTLELRSTCLCHPNAGIKAYTIMSRLFFKGYYYLLLLSGRQWGRETGELALRAQPAGSCLLCVLGLN